MIHKGLLPPSAVIGHHAPMKNTHWTPAVLASRPRFPAARCSAYGKTQMAQGVAGSCGTSILKSFLVEGFIGSDRVKAVYTEGLLIADATFMTQAHVGLLVDEVFGPVGPDGVAGWLLNLIGALDQVIRITFSLAPTAFVRPAVRTDGCG